MITQLFARQGTLSYRSRLIFCFLLVAVVLLVDFLLFRNIKNGHSSPKSLTELLHDEMPVPSVEPTLLSRKTIFGNILENGTSASEEVEVFYNKTLYAPGVILMAKGELGSQLFQYACAYTLARRVRWPFYIYYTPKTPLEESSGLSQKRDFLLDHFRIPLDNFMDKSTELAGAILNFGKKGVLENTFRMGKRMPKLFLQLNKGYPYHKAMPYWKRYVDDFRIMFKPREWAVNGKKLKKIRDKIRHSYESVSVHVSTDSTGNFPKLFYEHAMKKMAAILQSRGRPKPAFFLFFSDQKLSKEFEDIGYKMGDDFEMFYLGSGKKPTAVEEFNLMMMCNNIIFLRSTLAWWVDYLKDSTGKIGIAPSFNPKFLGKPVGNGSSELRFQVKLFGKVYDSKKWMELDSFGAQDDLIM